MGKVLLSMFPSDGGVRSTGPGVVKTAESVVQDPEWSALNRQSLGVAHVLGKCSVLVARSSVALFTSVVCVHRVLVVLNVTLRPSLARVSFPLSFAPFSLPRYYAVAQLV